MKDRESLPRLKAFRKLVDDARTLSEEAHRLSFESRSKRICLVESSLGTVTASLSNLALTDVDFRVHQMVLVAFAFGIDTE